MFAMFADAIPIVDPPTLVVVRIPEVEVSSVCTNSAES